MNNFKTVEHFETRNDEAVAYMIDELSKKEESVAKETAVNGIVIGALRSIARRAFGRIPLFRPTITDNSVETFQIWFNDFAEANNINKRIRVTGVWSEETKAAYDMLVA